MPSSTLHRMDPDVWLADPERHAEYVETMFDIIAPRYDRFTRVFSFGMDARWKRELVELARGALGPAETVLDLACGTGDLVAALAPLVPRGQVLGVDASAKMVELAEARAGELHLANAKFRRGDMCDLRWIPSASIDLVSVGYGLRNVAKLDACLAEIRRVLRPGGLLLSLDFTLPERRWWRGLFLAYLRVAGDAFGWWWHRDRSVYGYIARSLARFLTARELSDRLRRHRFEVREERRKLIGGVCLHVAWRYG